MKRILLTSRIITEDDHHKYIRLQNDYATAVTRAGGLPIVAQVTSDEKIIDEYIKIADAIIFTGGEDVNPNIYGADFHPSVQGICFERDEFEIKLLKKAIDKKIPVLGICRGMQLINAAMGGDLYQDINSEVKASSGHSFSKDLSRGILKINTEKGSIVNRLLGDEILVNQYHHQSVKTVAKDFVATSKSRDGIIESMEYTGDLYISCVQFHPEAMNDYEPKFLDIFKDLIERAWNMY